jgi:hypothetical protein
VNANNKQLYDKLVETAFNYLRSFFLFNFVSVNVEFVKGELEIKKENIHKMKSFVRE